MRNTEQLRHDLIKLGIPVQMAGFRYLEQAIILWTPGCMVTKELYPEIARICRVDFRAVEKSIRYAIRYAWINERFNLGLVYEIFGLWAIHTRPKPSEFIGAVAQWGGYVAEN